MNLEEISKLPKLKNGDAVNATTGKDSFKGKVIGLSSDDIMPIYIIECTDGFIPNETYPYVSCCIPRSYLEEIEQ